MTRKQMLAGGLAAVLTLAVSTAWAADKKTLVFVVNGASDFWKIAEAGVKKAQGSCRTTTSSSNIPSRPPPRCSSA